MLSGVGFPGRERYLHNTRTVLISLASSQLTACKDDARGVTSSDHTVSLLERVFDWLC
jgi:hypothetical protein